MLSGSSSYEFLHSAFRELILYVFGGRTLEGYGIVDKVKTTDDPLVFIS